MLGAIFRKFSLLSEKNEPKAIGKSNLSNLLTILMGMHWQKLGA